MKDPAAAVRTGIFTSCSSLANTGLAAATGALEWLVPEEVPGPGPGPGQQASWSARFNQPTLTLPLSSQALRLPAAFCGLWLFWAFASSLNALQWNPHLALLVLRCHLTVLSCVLYQTVKDELVSCVISALVSYFVVLCE